MDKENLKNLTWHAGFRVLEQIVTDFELDTLRELKRVNLADEAALKLLNAKQNYLLWAETLMSTIKSQINTMANKKFDK